MSFVYDPGAKWYFNPAINDWDQAVKTDEGYTYPGLGPDDSIQTIDDSTTEGQNQINQLLTQRRGYNPNDKKVLDNGYVGIMNPSTGQYEPGSATTSGNYMPQSMVAPGTSMGAMTEPKDTGTFGQILDIAKPLAFIGSAATAGNLIGNGINSLMSGGMNGFTSSAVDVDPSKVLTHSVTDNGGTWAAANEAADAAIGTAATGVAAPVGTGIGANVYGAAPFALPSGTSSLLGAASALGGSSSGGPVAGTSTTSNTQTFTPEQTAARQQMLTQAMKLFQQNAGATFPGAAPITPSADTVASQNALRSFSTGQGQMTADQIAKAMQFGLSDVLNPDANPALKSTLDTGIRRIGEAYTDPGGVISNIRTNFTAGNSGGTGTREGIAGGLAAKSYLNTIGDYTGKVTSDAYNKGLDTFSRTMALAPNSYNLMMQPGVTRGAVGAQIDMQEAEKAKYTADASAWNLQYPWQNLNSYAGVVNGTGAPTSTTTTTTPEAQKNPLAPVGGALLGTQIANMAGVSPLYGAAAGVLFGLM